MAKEIIKVDGGRIERRFFQNGIVSSEVTYIGEHIQGVTRKWHDNGVLKSEVPMLESRRHGVVREWNSRGELLGECEFAHGTGTHRSWYENGRIKSEGSMRDGIPCGRLRSWDEDGELLVEQFIVSGKRVSAKKYLEACSKDPSLPRYEDDGARPVLELETPSPPKPPAPLSLADYPDAQEAVAWLQASTDDAPRNIGECPPGEESLKVLREFYDQGAVKVLVVDILLDDDGSQNSGHLIIELPEDPKDRKDALTLINEHHLECGFDPEADVGQRFSLVALD